MKIVGVIKFALGEIYSWKIYSVIQKLYCLGGSVYISLYRCYDTK